MYIWYVSFHTLYLASCLYKFCTWSLCFSRRDRGFGLVSFRTVYVVDICGKSSLLVAGYFLLLFIYSSFFFCCICACVLKLRLSQWRKNCMRSREKIAERTGEKPATNREE